MTDQTCEERIEKQLSGRIGDIGATLKKINKAENKNKWDKADNLREELYDLPLEVTEIKVVHVLLSTGGPHDEFNFWIQDNEVTRIEYKFMDWFDGASRWLTGNDFDVMSEYFDRCFGWMLE